jgi:uncharacterized OsmC-like protein
MSVLTITHLADDAFRVDVRGHTLMVDQQNRDADEAGVTPVELFVASLASCVGFYAERFLRRHGLPFDGLQVECDWMMRAGEPARVGRIAIRVTPPGWVPPELRGPLGAAIDRCTVHNSLRQPPQIEVVVAPMPLASAGRGAVV